jgi:rhamnosyl/mannosyltransferase
MLQAYGDKVRVIPFGTDVHYWNSLTPEQLLRIEEIKRRHPRLVVFIGRLVPYKGLEVLIDGVRQIDAQLSIIGEGPMHKQLERQIFRQELTSRMTLTGQLTRDEVKCLLHAARVLAFPSVTTAEAFGIVQIEAMAAGCPVVNTHLPTAVPHIARHNQEGLTVPPGDSDQLAHALRRILDDSSFRTQLSSSARQRAFSEYDAETYRDRIAKIYNEVAAVRRRHLV